MASCQPFQQETPWDPFQGALQEYPEIENYVSNFQVDLKVSTTRRKSNSPRQYKDSIVVFKKKKLPIGTLRFHSNIYDHDPSNLELDAQNEKKSRSSCLRCRKFKKKCTRDLPECLNCVSCDELCIYTTRKRKSSVASSSSTTDLDKRDSYCSTPNSCTSRSRSGSQGIDEIDTSHVPFHQGASEPVEDLSKRRRFSMPIKFGARDNMDAKDDANYRYNSGSTGYHASSDLYKLLN